MMMFGAMIGAARRLREHMRWLDKPLRTRPFSRAPLSPASPKTFAAYACPRFELRYPKDWTLDDRDGVHVASPRLGTFAHVDVLRADADPWAPNALLRDVRAKGDRARGALTAGGYEFAWEARRFLAGTEQVVLATGNVVDAKRSKAIEAYEDAVLAAVRRHFRVNVGASPQR